MSENEFKSGFRVNIESLRGKNRTEALEYFRCLLGEPSEIDQYDGRIEYFRYDGEYQANQEYSYKAYPSKDDGWFVDKVLSSGCESDGNDGLYLKIDDVIKTVEELKAKFGVEEKDIMVFSYSWYNGSDEPRYMQPRKLIY